MNLDRDTAQISDIVCVSALNPRHDDASDITTLAATIRDKGVLHPLLVRPRDHGYEVLAGSRRLRALQQVRDERDGHDEPFPILVFTGTDDEAREAILAVEATVDPVHPVDLYECFASLANDDDAIARAFGFTLRKVREIKALGRIAPEIRTAWRRGDISREIVEAYATAETLEAQTALFAKAADGGHWATQPRDIRKMLRADAVSFPTPEALYVGEDAYRAAGGRIDESLFVEEIVWRDGSLLKQLAETKLTAEAERIAAEEGWGFSAITDTGFAEPGVAPDYGDEDDAYSALQDRLQTGACETPEEADEAEAKLAAMDARAMLRAVPQTDRGRFAVIVWLDTNGRAVAERGLVPVRPQETPEPAPEPRKASRKDPAPAPAPAPAQAEPGKQMREVLDAAIEKAFAAAVRRRPDVAIMLALAALTEFGRTAYGFDLSSYRLNDEACTLLRLLSKRHFEEKLAAVAEAENADCITAFAEAIGDCIHVAGVPFARMEWLAKALVRRGVALDRDLYATFDFDAYFAAAAKEATLAAVAACDGDTKHAKKLKKPDLAKYAAGLALAKHWLPAPLAEWAALVPVAPASSADKDPQEAQKSVAAYLGADAGTASPASADTPAMADDALTARVRATIEARLAADQKVAAVALADEIGRLGEGARLVSLPTFQLAHAQIHDGEEIADEVLAATLHRLSLTLKPFRAKTWVAVAAASQQQAAG